MSRRARRIFITSAVLLVAAAVVAAVFFSPGRSAPPQPVANPPQAATQPQSIAAAPQSTPADAASQTQPQPAVNSDAAVSATQPQTPATQPLGGLRAVAPGNDIGPRDQPPQPLGSLDPRVSVLQVNFTRLGAGIQAIPFSDIWETATAKRTANRYFRQLPPGAPIDFDQLDEDQRYVLAATTPYIWGGETYSVPVMAAHSIIVDDQDILLLREEIWSETAQGRFATRIVDEQGNPVLEITRQYSLGANYDITLKQSVRNLSDRAVAVQWRQYGPTELRADVSGYIDRRRFSIGYLPDPVRQPNLVLVGDLDAERSDLLKRPEKAAKTTDLEQWRDLVTIWPNPTSRTRGYDLSWFASLNRYFALAVHPSGEQVSSGTYSLKTAVQEIGLNVSAGVAEQQVVFTSLISPNATINPGGDAAFDLAVYAGPLDRGVLGKIEPYATLSMSEMIVYRMAGGCCSFLTFQWLARFLLWFLSFLHDYIVFDWGVAIILLVGVVRTLLHPLTKRSQINMQRFGKQMSAMKPEIDKLQKKYGNEPKRMQAEQMKLMREAGLNPFQMLGCLPMFLQTPIWIALWAMLYLAFEIRHQPAFYGVFQLLGDWQFLGDLSSPDDFWILPGGGFTIPLVGWHISSLNLLPLLLGVVFYVQQKYMSPPPTPNMTAEQLQQQRIMKVMLVLMMPIFLYKAPSGLTLYIFTSTCIGILESKYIRAHINQIDLLPPKPAGPAEPKKPRDPRLRAWADAVDRARAKRRGGDEPPRSFKKRK